jgi:hypothetical protein
MKPTKVFQNLLLVAVLLMLCTATFAAQVPQDTMSAGTLRHQVLFSTLPLFVGTLAVSYEHVFPAKGALRVTPSYTHRGNANNAYGRRGHGLDIGYKVYAPGVLNMPNFYIGPYLMYRHADIFDLQGEPNLELAIDAYGIGLDMGTKFYFGRVVADASVGGGFRRPILSHEYPNDAFFPDMLDNTYDYKGFAIRLSISLGIAF